MLEFMASVRITGRDLNPDEVSRLLNLVPTSSHRRGDPHFGKGGRYSDHSEGLWAFKSPLEESKSLRDHLSYLKNQLDGREKAIAKLKANNYKVEVFIGVFEIGDGDEFALSALEMSDLAALHVDISFDLYTYNEPVDRES